MCVDFLCWCIVCIYCVTSCITCTVLTYCVDALYSYTVWHVVDCVDVWCSCTVWHLVNILLRCGVDVLCWWCIVWTFWWYRVRYYITNSVLTYCVDVLSSYTVWHLVNILLRCGVDVLCWLCWVNMLCVHSVFMYCVDGLCWCMMFIHCVTSCEYSVER